MAARVAPTIAGRGGVVILNADRMQLYADLPTLTARPTEPPPEGVEFALYGILGPKQTCHVGEWVARAVESIHQAHADEKTVLITGGTGLYIKALVEGLAPIPDTEEEVRTRLQEELAAKGAEVLRAELEAEDPQSAKNLVPGDTQRLLRALEVLRGTGKGLAYWHEQPKERPLPEVDFQGIWLDIAREHLYARCDERLLAMWKKGAAREVWQLLVRGVALTDPIAQALGFKEIAAFLSGKISEEEATIQAQTTTRHYAKRQVTFFRHQLPLLMPSKGEWPFTTHSGHHEAP